MVIIVAVAFPVQMYNDNELRDSPVLVPVHLELGVALHHALELRVHLAVDAEHFLLILRLRSCRRRHVV